MKETNVDKLKKYIKNQIHLWHDDKGDDTLKFVCIDILQDILRKIKSLEFEEHNGDED